jgi:hypothetical protein
MGAGERLGGEGYVHHQEPEVVARAKRIQGRLKPDFVRIPVANGNHPAQPLHGPGGLGLPLGRRDTRSGHPGQARKLRVTSGRLEQVRTRPRRQPVAQPQRPPGIGGRARGVAEIAECQPAPPHAAEQGAEVAYGAEVRDVVADADTAGDVGSSAAHDLARGPGTGGIAVEQKGDHHPGMERRLAPQFTFVLF